MSATEPEVIEPEKQKRTRAIAKQEPKEVAAPKGDVDLLMIEAVRSGNIEVMERVMAIRRELKAEMAKEAFFAAMAAFQAECPVITKDKAVWNKEHTRVIYHYAPLDKIVKQTAPIIAKHGLSYDFKAYIEGEGESQTLVMECHVHHEAGHSEVSPFRLPVAGDYMNKAQQRGNTNSYAKRYSFCNAFGILTEDEDQDGADAPGRKLTPQQARDAKREVRQPKMTPTAQRAATAQTKPRVELEPAAEGEGIDEKIATGIWDAVMHAFKGYGDDAKSIALAEFRKRFPKLEKLGQIKRGDEQVVLSWIADPTRN